MKFDIKILQKKLNQLSLNSETIEYLNDLIKEYNEKKTLRLWENSSDKELSQIIANILNLRDSVENIVIKSNDFEEFNSRLENIIDKMIPDIDCLCKHEIVRCLLKDMTLQDFVEKENYEKIYMEWCKIFEGKNV